MKNVFSQWQRELIKYRRDFIRMKGWNSSQAGNYTRDAWACLRDGKIRILPASSVQPAGALPIFEIRTPLGWRVPMPLRLNIAIRLRDHENATRSNKTPRERVKAMFAMACVCGDRVRPENFEISDTTLERLFRYMTRADHKTSGDAGIKRMIAAQAARDTFNVCESDALLGIEGDALWHAILTAVRFGRRQLLAEIYADEEAMESNLRGEAMNRKGKTVTVRRSPIDPFRALKEIVAKMTRQAMAEGKDAKNAWSRVRVLLSKEGASFYLLEGTRLVSLDGGEVQEETLRKWVRQELRELFS